MQLTIIESPYAGDIDKNVEYAQKCMHDSLLRNEAPYASHLLYTQPNVLDDTILSERARGIRAGFAWKYLPNVLTVFYVDLGWSAGMILALDYCKNNNMPYEERSLFSEDK